MTFGLWAGLLTGCDWVASQPNNPINAHLSDEDKALKSKFRGMKGGELLIGATEELSAVNLYLPNGLSFAQGVFNVGAKISSYGGSGKGDNLVMPKSLRYVRFPPDAKYRNEPGEPYPAFDGEPVTDVTVPVASRIPDDLLDDLRRDPKGDLRLKIRLMPEAILIGWDIERRSSRYDPINQKMTYGSGVHSFVGGDFREAKIYNGIAERKGWYIHPKTGQRIETDF